MTIYIPQSIQTSQSVMPAVDFVAPLTPDQATIGTKNIQAFGEGLQQAGKTLLKQDVDAINKALNIRVQEKFNELDAFTPEILYGNKDKNLKGVNSYRGGDIFSKDFNGKPLEEHFISLYDEKVNQLSNDLPEEARASFLAKTQPKRNSILQNLSSYANTQSLKYQNDVHLNTQKQSTANFLISETDDEKKQSLEQGKMASRELAVLQGEDPSVAEKSFISDTISSSILMYANSDQYQKAESLFKEYKKQLDPDAIVKIQPVMSRIASERLVRNNLGIAESKIGEIISESTGVGKVFDAIVMTESGGRNVVNSIGATGPAQVMPETGKQMAKEMGLDWNEEEFKTNPEYSKSLGKAYLSKMIKNFGNVNMGIAAYNAGEQGVKDAIKKSKIETGSESNWFDFLPEETKNHFQKTQKNLAQSSNNWLPPKKIFISQRNAEFEAENPNATPEEKKMFNSGVSEIWETYNAENELRVSDVKASLLNSVSNKEPLNQFMMNSLPLKDQKEILSYQTDVLQGKFIQTDLDLYTKLSSDALLLGKYNLPANKNKFNNQDYLFLEKLQKDINDNPRIQTNVQIISRALDDSGYTSSQGTTSENKKAIDEERKKAEQLVYDNLERFQSKQKEPLTLDQVKEITNKTLAPIILFNPDIRIPTLIQKRITEPLIVNEDLQKNEYRNIALPPSEYQRYRDSYIRIFKKEPTEDQLKIYYYSVRTGRQ